MKKIASVSYGFKSTSRLLIFLLCGLLIVIQFISPAKAEGKRKNILVGKFDETFAVEDEIDSEYCIFRFITWMAFRDEGEGSEEYEEINEYSWTDGKGYSVAYVYVRMKRKSFNSMFDYESTYAITVSSTEKTVRCSFRDEQPSDYDVLTMENDDAGILPYCNATEMSDEPYYVEGKFNADAEVCDYPILPEILSNTAIYRFKLNKELGEEYIVMEKKMFNKTFSGNRRYSFFVFDTGREYQGKKLYTNFFYPQLDYMTNFKFHSYEDSDDDDGHANSESRKTDNANYYKEFIKFLIPVIIIVFVGLAMSYHNRKDDGGVR